MIREERTAMPEQESGDLILDPNQDYRSAMRALIGARWVELWEAVPVALEGTDPEGVHKVRVASRRLRAAMDVATDSFPKPWYRALHKTAKRITGALGDVRDRDVLLEALGKQRARARVAERPGIDHLIATVEAERAVARTEMTKFLTKLDKRGLREETRRRFPPPSEAIAPAPGTEERKNGERAR
jgi:CHAD domain-containing protein